MIYRLKHWILAWACLGECIAVLCTFTFFWPPLIIFFEKKLFPRDER
ncbi:hypothetical protein LCGC14_1276650 [marine sediment metagenome]|uniref:Uncharacterized protein n=1 Tax=marine sediment metagenome TaxID=412755 RepID=A0A0F9KY74_9ZZZZ